MNEQEVGDSLRGRGAKPVKQGRLPRNGEGAREGARDPASSGGGIDRSAGAGEIDRGAGAGAPAGALRSARGSLPSLIRRARAAASAAEDFLFRVQRGDHWCAELESNTSITAEYVFLRQALGLDLADRKEAIARYLFSRQKSDGSFGIAHNLPGDVSTAVETYLALRLLGLPEGDDRMLRAERFIRGAGGIARVRVFTRINLALFGLFPWDAVPFLPPEFVLLPSWSPVNIYRLSSWARSTMVPLFILFHHRPNFALPDGDSGWLDHLWLDPTRKGVPYRASVLDTLRSDGIGWKAFFNAGDALLRLYENARSIPPMPRLRERALRECERWVLEHEEASGDWAGIFPPMLNGVLALRLAGHALDSDPVTRGLEAIERFGILDGEGFHLLIGIPLPLPLTVEEEIPPESRATVFRGETLAMFNGCCNFCLSGSSLHHAILGVWMKLNTHPRTLVYQRSAPRRCGFCHVSARG